MIKQFKFLFHELNIVSSDLNEYLGVNDEAIPEPFPELIDRAINSAPEFCDIKGGYKIFSEIKVNKTTQKIDIERVSFSPGKIICTQLKNASSCALFVCTAGDGISKESKRLSAGEDPLLGYVFDVLGSVIVEKAMDLIEKKIEFKCVKTGLHISDRYSPGYCDWSVSEQQLLFGLLPPRFCGVALSDSSLMSPIKSISGIIGIGSKLSQKGYQCNWCTDTNCIYGRIRRKNTQDIKH